MHAMSFDCKTSRVMQSWARFGPQAATRAPGIIDNKDHIDWDVPGETVYWLTAKPGDDAGASGSLLATRDDLVELAWCNFFSHPAKKLPL